MPSLTHAARVPPLVWPRTDAKVYAPRMVVDMRTNARHCPCARNLLRLRVLLTQRLTPRKLPCCGGSLFTMGKQSKHMKHKQIYLIDLKASVAESKAAKCNCNDLFVSACLPKPENSASAPSFRVCAPLTRAACPCPRAQTESTQKVLDAYVKKYDVSMKSPLVAGMLVK